MGRERERGFGERERVIQTEGSKVRRQSRERKTFIHDSEDKRERHNNYDYCISIDLKKINYIQSNQIQVKKMTEREKE